MLVGSPHRLDFTGVRQAMFICSDALVQHPARIGPAELYPLAPLGTFDLAKAFRESMRRIGIQDRPLMELNDAIGVEFDRRSPLFLLRFPRILFPLEDASILLLPYIKRVFGVLCLYRGSYAKVLAGYFIDSYYDKELSQRYYPFNMNSYYRGYLVGAFPPVGDMLNWDTCYKVCAESPFLTELLNKTNAAFAETDLDMAVFRFWAILETVVFHKYREKKLAVVKRLIVEYYHPADPEKIVVLKVGERLFSFSELLAMWLNWRDTTAHHGSLGAYHDGTVRVHGGLVDLMRVSLKNGILMEYGDERSLFVLKDVVVTVVKRHIKNSIS